jgi:hypothetical protein
MITFEQYCLEGDNWTDAQRYHGKAKPDLGGSVPGLDRPAVNPHEPGYDPADQKSYVTAIGDQLIGSRQVGAAITDLLQNPALQGVWNQELPIYKDVKMGTGGYEHKMGKKKGQVVSYTPGPVKDSDDLQQRKDKAFTSALPDPKD